MQSKNSESKNNQKEIISDKILPGEVHQGANLRLFCLMRDWDEYYIAEHLKVSDRTVRAWYNSRVIPQKRLEQLAKLFNFDIFYLRDATRQDIIDKLVTGDYCTNYFVKNNLIYQNPIETIMALHQEFTKKADEEKEKLETKLKEAQEKTYQLYEEIIKLKEKENEILEKTNKQLQVIIEKFTK